MVQTFTEKKINNSKDNAPLSGIRILAISQFGAGPFATLLLSDLGAEIIKIEDPLSEGDVARKVPPFVFEGDSTYFQTFNRGKKSIALDFRTIEGRKIFEDLVRKSDVVFNNLRGDLPERLGITYNTLKQINPMIVTCSLSGFGSKGKLSSKPGYDPIIQALTGYMSLTGEINSPPIKTGVSIIDFSAGFAAALGISAALVDVKINKIGRNVDISLFNTAISMLTYLASWYLNHQWIPEKQNFSAHQSITPAQNYKTFDGWITIFCAKEKFWINLVGIMEFNHLNNDERFTSFSQREKNRKELNEILEPIFLNKTTDYWIKLFENKIPAAPILSMEDSMDSLVKESSESFININHPLMGIMRFIKSPFDTEGANINNEPAPKLGQNTDEILLTLLGYNENKIIELKRTGIIT